MDEQTLILFDDYINGALSLAEQKELEIRISNDPKLADAFEVFKDLNGHLDHQLSSDRATFIKQLDVLADTHLNSVSTQNTSQTTPSEDTTKLIRFKPWRYVAAACVVMFFSVLLWLNIRPPSYSQYAFDDDITLTVRSNGEVAFAKAEDAFNKGAYEEAIGYFNSILSNTPENAEVSYYKGIAFVELLKFEEADALFIKVANGKSVFKYKAVWYHALSKLKQKDTGACKRLLKRIPKEAEDYSRAQELLDRL